MSTYEKIASVVIALLLIPMIIFSYREIKEQPETGGTKTSRSFNESLGQDFKIGSFATIVSERSSGGSEDACESLQPVIIAVLHDIERHLEQQHAFAGEGDAFGVNEPTLQLLCHKNAEITLADSNGNTLVLQKVPFVRAVPPQGTAADIGTKVHINATVIPAGAPTPTQPTTYGDLLIPDRFLGTATSSSS